MSKYVTAAEAVKVVKSGDRVYLQAAAAAPTILANALTERASELRDVEICHLHVEGEARYANPELRDSFHVNSFFMGANVRHTLKAGNGSYTPVFLSELPHLFRKNVLPLDVAFIHVSPPDRHGYCSLGVSVEATVAAIENAKIVVAQVNPQMPRTFGDGIMHVSEIDYLVEVDTPIYGHDVVPFTAEEEKIGSYIASLIEDESTLQMGIGSIPNAALSKLTNHKNLGLHTEMFSDGVIDLIESDVINCNYKGTLRGRVLATFLMGSKRLYDYVNDNPFIEMKESSMVNDTARIRKNPKMVAINSAIEVDLTGQVCADSIGPQMYSGVGGQMDFIRGASLSCNHKSTHSLRNYRKRSRRFIRKNIKTTCCRIGKNCTSKSPRKH
jgi:acyl-CoA hydrolase